jgi:hypothetical protein
VRRGIVNVAIGSPRGPGDYQPPLPVFLPG